MKRIENALYVLDDIASSIEAIERRAKEEGLPSDPGMEACLFAIEEAMNIIGPFIDTI